MATQIAEEQPLGYVSLFDTNLGSYDDILWMTSFHAFGLKPASARGEPFMPNEKDISSPETKLPKILLQAGLYIAPHTKNVDDVFIRLGMLLKEHHQPWVSSQSR